MHGAAAVGVTSNNRVPSIYAANAGSVRYRLGMYDRGQGRAFQHESVLVALGIPIISHGHAAVVAPREQTR